VTETNDTARVTDWEPVAWPQWYAYEAKTARAALDLDYHHQQMVARENNVPVHKKDAA